jgi:hypothetical protein
MKALHFNGFPEAEGMAGTIMAHYRFEENPFEDGMGNVYRAHDTNLNQDTVTQHL